MFDLDLILAIAHHFAVFAVFGLLLAEVALLTPGMTADRIRKLGAIDGFYGAASVLVIVAGVSRVIWGAAGWEYYVANWAFWAKMAAFILVGLLSVPPTLAVLRWRKELAANPSFTPDAAQVSRLRRFFTGELIAFAFIPAFAAAMARGYGAM
jgi:putative membrane protein